MQFDIIDPNVSTAMNVAMVIANIINLAYNIPQMIKTYKLRTTSDISGWFLFLRMVGNGIWIGYAVEIGSLMMLTNNIVTVVSSVFIGYFKLLEDYEQRNLEPLLEVALR